jgi:glycine cleavage system aminomethyltransferase T/glycine/D-amino acid oxidase-like deaminating enzyme
LRAQRPSETIARVMRDRVETIVVGAGIVGASAAYHLAELGSSDVLVLEQGPLFETGGSTSHAPGLAFQTNPSRAMCRIAQDSVALYSTLEDDGEPAWHGVGGIEVATTPERMRELKRRLGLARSCGLDGAELMTPSDTVELIPLLDPSTIHGAFHVPTDGIAKGVRIASALAGKASERGVEFEGGVTVTGFDIHDGRVHGVQTDRGVIECERVLICAGIWGPTLGAMAGAPIPLLAVQHQLVWTDPVPELEGETREVVHPILRHQDMAMYFRHREDHYAVGNYKHEPIATPQSALRHPSDPGPMPSLMPWTPRDFDLAEAEAARLLPALKGRMRPGDPSRSINGMFSFTPDAASIVGESAKVRGVWVCEAVWVTHAGGMGRQVAEWMVNGEPSYDLAEMDANRFYPYATTPPYVLERGKQQYREVYDIIHPRQQPARPRKLRLSPFYARHIELGGQFVVGAGWERPQWFEANATLVPSDAPWLRRDDWAAKLWSPIEGAEHLATRNAVALFDVTAFAKFDVQGADALRFLERVFANRIDRPVGSLVYTAALTPRGGIRLDLTIARKREDLFRIVTGGGSGQHDLAWLRRQIRDERVSITERTGSLFTLGLWGPKARDVLAAVTDADLSNEAFPYMTAQYLNVGEVAPVWAQRISYAGELGWELYGQFAMGDRTWELLWNAGREHGIVAAGLGAFDTLRLEKGYRFWGQDISTEYDPFEAGIGFAVKMDKDFEGKDALERKLEPGIARKLSCITFDDPSHVVMGKEPIRANGDVVGFVTSAGYGYSIGRCIAYGYLPNDLASEGTALEIEYFDERLPAHVAAEPLWDPKGERLRA